MAMVVAYSMIVSMAILEVEVYHLFENSDDKVA